MKDSLEKGLKAYNKVIKEVDALEGDEETKFRAQLDMEGDVTETQYQTRDTDPGIEYELLDMQKSKAKEVAKLRQMLKRIDRNEPMEESEAPLIVFKDGKYIIETENGESEEHPLTAGEIITGPEFQLNYNLDPKTVPRAVRKRYALECAKFLVGFMADLQILTDETNGPHSPDAVLDIYGQKLLEHLGHTETPIGIEFEVIARTTLKRLAFDCNLNFSVIDADVHQDVEQMSDFFIRRNGSSKLIAVQFTTSPHQGDIDKRTSRATRMARKRPDLEKVIVVPMVLAEHPRRLLRQWTDNPDPKSHPLQYVPAEFQEQVCDSILKLALPEAEYNSSMATIRKFLSVPPHSEPAPSQENIQ